MCPAIPQNRQHDYSWGIISNQHLKKGQTIRGGKKREAAPVGEAEGYKKRKTPLPDYVPDADEDEEEWPDRAKCPARS